MIPIDFNSVYEALKKQGLFAMFLGLIIFVQYKNNEDTKANNLKELTEMRQENKEQQAQIKKQFEDRISDLEQRLLDCEKQRNEEIIRRIERSVRK
jgi:hypothetical protein